jgi:TPR repeat protein
MDTADLRAKAERGSAVAQCMLGIALLEGIDVAQDYPEALRWLEAASGKGAARAMVWLGWMRERGLGAPVDVERANELFEMAAERGEFLGCVFLARLLVARGDGGGALRWYREAAGQRGRVFEGPELEEAAQYVAEHSDTDA